MSNGSAEAKPNRVSYVQNEWGPPEPTAGAEWAADIFFNAAEELLRDGLVAALMSALILMLRAGWTGR